MSKSKPLMDTLQPYEAFADWIPHRISKRQLLNMAETCRFPTYVKAYPRSTPLWRLGDVVEWIAANYGEVLPDYCDRLGREGLSGLPFSHGKPV